MAVSIRKRAISELVLADCQPTDEVRDVVRISADAVGGVYQVGKLDITSSAAELALGVIISKASPTRCTVQVGGQMAGIYTGLDAGKPLFVGGDAKLTHVVPIHPATGIKWVHFIAQALSSDVVLLQVQGPSKIRA